VRGVFALIQTQKDESTQFLVPWHPTAAATNNLMTDLYSANEMSGLWPGLRPQKSVENWPPRLWGYRHCTFCQPAAGTITCIATHHPPWCMMAHMACWETEETG
jgi:hypothetical protein